MDYAVANDVCNWVLCLCVWKTDVSARACVITWHCRRHVLTRDLIQALSGNVIILIDPFSITFEVDLGGRRRPTPQLDRAVLHDEGVLRLQQKFWEGLRWGRREGIREDLSIAVVAALWKHRRPQLRWRPVSVRVTAMLFAARPKPHTWRVCTWLTTSHIHHKANLIRGHLRCWQFAVWKGPRWHFHLLVLSGIRSLPLPCLREGPCLSSGGRRFWPSADVSCWSRITSWHFQCDNLLSAILPRAALPGRTLPFWPRHTNRFMSAWRSKSQLQH